MDLDAIADDQRRSLYERAARRLAERATDEETSVEPAPDREPGGAGAIPRRPERPVPPSSPWGAAGR